MFDSLPPRGELACKRAWAIMPTVFSRHARSHDSRSLALTAAFWATYCGMNSRIGAWHRLVHPHRGPAGPTDRDVRECGALRRFAY